MAILSQKMTRKFLFNFESISVTLGSVIVEKKNGVIRIFDAHGRNNALHFRFGAILKAIFLGWNDTLRLNGGIYGDIGDCHVSISRGLKRLF